MRSLLVFLAHMAILLVVAKEQTTLPKACIAIKKLEKKLDKLAQNLGEKLENLTALINKTPGKELT